ncbi:MAG: F0F1 ATP synthase subunit delta [Gammaproteobacteria bacterium]|nr:F0F1 ATP synthase subunit delta [Gammaproteobacteria bacterium]
MAEKITIARPYAQAAFDLAKDAGDLKGWSAMLQLVAMITDDATMDDLIGNPHVARETLVDIIIDICGDNLNEAGKNFVRVLGENKRLNVVSEIAERYEAQRAEAEKTVDAEVVSAFELSDAQVASLSAALKKRLGRDVKLVTKIDESIIGGAIVQAGDLVIDGSISSQLHKLSHTLMS